MSEIFESVKGGMYGAIAHQEGKKTGIKVYKPDAVDVKKVREKTELTQEQFAATFGISLGTLRHWERGDRAPQGPALVLLNAIERDPATVLRILGSGRSA